MLLFVMQEQPLFVLLSLVCLNLLLSFELRGSTWQLLTWFVCSGCLKPCYWISQAAKFSLFLLWDGLETAALFELEGSTRQILTLRVIFGCRLGTSEVCKYPLKLCDFRDLLVLMSFLGPLQAFWGPWVKQTTSPAVLLRVHFTVGSSIACAWSILWRQANCWYAGRCLPVVTII